MSYNPMFKNQFVAQRKAVLKLGLVKDNELLFMSDGEVADLIRKSDFLIFQNGDDFALLPKEFENKITWICR